jgi:hypothetical protein
MRWQFDYEETRKKILLRLHFCTCNRNTAARPKLFRDNASEQMEKCIQRSNVDQPRNLKPCVLGPSVVATKPVEPSRLSTGETKAMELRAKRNMRRETREVSVAAEPASYKLLQLLADGSRHGTVENTVRFWPVGEQE